MGMLTVNSPVCSMMVWVCRVGAMLMARSGGLFEVGMVHARVVMFGLFVFGWQVISVVCMGWSSRVAWLGFIVVFVDMVCLCRFGWVCLF